VGEVTDQVTTATIVTTPKNNSNHLSVHQWIRSAIRDSQQSTSPIGFLFLKPPPPPCAALLVQYIDRNISLQTILGMSLLNSTAWETYRSHRTLKSTQASKGQNTYTWDCCGIVDAAI